MSTPNMGMVLPGVSSTAGPLYAAENNQAFSVIDAHDHSAGNGLPIPTSGISLNGDLPLNSFNLSLVRSTQYNNQVSPLALPTDIRSVYVVGGDLYYNNNIGQQIQITAGAALNATSIGGIGGDYGTSTASFFYTSFTSTFTAWSAPNTPAAIDAGPLTLRTITLSPFGITLNSPGTLSADYSLTLFNSLPASTKILTVDPSGNIGDVYDVDNSTIEVAANVIQLKDDGITNVKVNTAANIDGSKLADYSIQQIKKFPMSIGSTVGAGDFAISASCGSFGSSSLTIVPVTNLSVTITTTGRPVVIGLQSDPNTSATCSVGINGPTTDIGYIYIFNGTVSIYTAQMQNSASGRLDIPPLSGFIDTTVNGTPGTYTYAIKVAVTAAALNINITNCIMYAYEI